jgi:hypothetical protein
MKTFRTVPYLTFFILVLMAKTSQFKASCEDLKKLKESWTYKTAKIFSRIRHARP